MCPGRKCFKIQLTHSFYCSGFHDFFDLNFLLQVTIGGAKTFMGRGKNLVGEKTPKETPSCNYDHFTTASSLLKLFFNKMDIIKIVCINPCFPSEKNNG